MAVTAVVSAVADSTAAALAAAVFTVVAAAGTEVVAAGTVAAGTVRVGTAATVDGVILPTGTAIPTVSTTVIDWGYDYGDPGYDYGYDNGYGNGYGPGVYGQEGDGQNPGAYTAPPQVNGQLGQYCRTQVKICQLYHASNVGAGCSCRTGASRAYGQVTP